MSDTPIETLKRTALYDLHVAHGGKMVPFAGYEMPVQFEGVKAEHLWVREKAGLFDVSHMGPCFLALAGGHSSDPAAHDEIAALIETLVPSDIRGLKPGQARLTVLLNEEGGILDDLIVTRPFAEDRQGMLYIVVNGAVKHQDWSIFSSRLGSAATLMRADDRILFALQGPEAADVLSAHFPGCETLSFMHGRPMMLGGGLCVVSRCGYTGEDGFEVLVHAEPGRALVEKLLSDQRVKPIGLGARDSLRLEAGLCLYGHDMDATRTPVEADLQWVIQKTRRERADFPGAERILEQLRTGPAEKRVGIRPLGRAPAREGVEIVLPGRLAGTAGGTPGGTGGGTGGTPVGRITSGGFGPSVDRPVAMGYVRADLAVPGTPVELMIRDKAYPAEVCALPFVPARYKR